MKVICVEDELAVGIEAARLISAVIRLKPDCNLGLATGTTPITTYNELVRMYEEEGLDFSLVSTFNLDEYIGLDADHPQSYAYFMAEHLLSKVNIKKENTHIPNGKTLRVDRTCSAYDKKIENSGGLDLQLLGIGRNGHIGFNEPGTKFVAETHKINLTEDTIKANSRFFEREEDVPRTAITIGMRSIMNARRILLIATGESKTDAVHALLCGEITPQVPASLLQLHPEMTVIVDRAALGGTSLPNSLFSDD
ncbi:MAG: glucosamine-6-phosphate deaminase [Eubacteriales bacterium]|nr:glucosamine-6-phosphate deaminase [Eubacteriales bacterium]